MPSTSSLPTFRSDLRIIPENSNGKPSVYFAKNPESGKIVKFGKEEHFLCLQMDGKTPLSEINRRFETSFGTPISPEHLEAFVRQLSAEGLLADSIDAPALNFRPKLFQADKWKRWKLGNPDRVLGWLAPHLSWCFTKTFVIGSLGIILLGVLTLVFNWRDLLIDFRNLYHPNLITRVLVYWVFFVNLPNWSAKALACKHYGGHVREFGIWLAFNIIPQFYFDFWEFRWFREKSRRLKTLSAGTFFCFIIWSVSIILWKSTEGWMSVHKFFLSLIVVSSIEILLNINPFSKRPGSMLLSDMLSAPNLRDRAMATARALITFRPVPEALTAREKLVFRLYGLLAIGYSVTVVLLVFLFGANWLTQHYQGSGALLLTGLAFVVFQQPIKQHLTRLRTTQWLKGKVSLMKRSRLIKIGLWSLLVLLLFVPYPYHVGGDFQFLPPTQAGARALVSGEIDQVYAEEGQWVNKDQPLALQSTRVHQKDLDATQASLDEKKAKLALVKGGAKPEQIDKAKQQVDRARVKLEYDTKQANRLKGLFEQGVVSEEDYDNAAKAADVDREQLEVAKAELKLVVASFRPEEIQALEAEVRRLQTEVDYYKQNVELTKILSPLSGQVVTPYLSKKIGQNLKEGDIFAVIQDARTIQAEVHVPEADVSEVSVGAKVTVKAWAYPSNAFTGTVTLIAPVVEKQSNGNVVRVLTDISNPNLLLKPDMTGYAKIDSGPMPVGIILSRLLYRFFMVEVWYWIP